MSILPILDEEDKKNQYISIKTDISKIKHIEDELNQAKIDAEKASKIKSQFLANMSHEIRTPLNAILGFSDVLANVELDKKNKEYAQIISNSADSLLNIINDILDISKIESGNFHLVKEAVEIHTFIDQIVELFSVRTKEKNIRFVYYMEPEVPFIIQVDATKLRQVIANLLSNAIKFTPKNGRIDFYIRLVEIKENTAKIIFTIKDTGIGINAEQKKLIFKPFQQADETVSKKFGGTGLGLAISNDIVKLMGSRIYINSNIGKGSEFLVTLDLEIDKLENENKIEYEPLVFVLCDAKNGEYLDISLELHLKNIGKVHNVNDPDCQYADMLFCFKADDFELINRFKNFNKNLCVVYAGDENHLNFKDILKIDYFIDLPLYESKISNLIADAFNLNKADTEIPSVMRELDVNILLAEDNVNNQKLMCVLLSKIGAKCTIAEDGYEALKLYKDNKFDLVLMDINMPHLDGLRATDELLEAQ
ncbi:MAG: response regulator, partial [Campylobacteraceae bacterium]|nr:response regulator [Campylobacteraceae bacterium]